MHIVLFGDSILDNGPYTGSGPDVVTQLRELLGAGGDATLLAVDGSCTYHVPSQLGGLPPAATHAVLSVGGNDALTLSEVLAQPVSSVGEALGEFDELLDDFGRAYAAALDAVLGTGLPTAVLTIYNGWFDASERAMLRSAIRLFNDVILDTALSRGVPVIELRRVCTEAGDYANPIEPNSQGGEKIARWILRLVRQHDFANDPVVLPGAQEPN